MRLGLKLVAFGIILLLPKTNLYLANAYFSEAKTAPEHTMSGSVAHANSTSYLMVSAEGKQAKSSTCAAKPGHDANDSLTVHARWMRARKGQKDHKQLAGKNRADGRVVRWPPAEQWVSRCPLSC